jgi:hypothetical protein
MSNSNRQLQHQRLVDAHCSTPQAEAEQLGGFFVDQPSADFQAVKLESGFTLLRGFVTPFSLSVSSSALFPTL